MLSKKQVFLAPCFTFSRILFWSAIGLGLNVNTENSRLVHGVLMLKTVVNDLRQHFEFAHAIVVAIGDDYVPQNVKKAVMDELLLMKLMEDALEGGYNRWHYEVLRNGPGPS
ncbi:hypothetical protein D8674_039433 [Pyrus ussuriensis x Pyrus communis]|uniref:Uncharacterized protein n=1 Tax=Pyrus ussuriensis x Pyrus communis TaxID=2448454 RepID=A0A5N5GWF6_9ROSA|nr:hypothetical protein D8674_039433 [Pyrus ussuriensis x Pyrus communis]